jgi:hypothetical protein
VSEDREVMRNELIGRNETRVCTVCDLPKPTSRLLLVSAETIGHVGGGNVDICIDCFRSLQRGEVEPLGDPDI